MWVVMQIQKFKDMQFQRVMGLSAEIQIEAEPYHYLPVFETYEAAMVWTDGATEYIQEIRPVKAAS